MNLLEITNKLASFRERSSLLRTGALSRGVAPSGDAALSNSAENREPDANLSFGLAASNSHIHSKKSTCSKTPKGFLAHRNLRFLVFPDGANPLVDAMSNFKGVRPEAANLVNYIKKLLPILMLTLLAPAVHAQSLPYRILDNIFGVFRTLEVSPYDKLITFLLLFTLFSATFIIALKNAFSENTRQVKVIAVVLAFAMSWAIVAGTRFSITQYGGVALAILGLLIFFLIYAVIRQFGMHERPVLAFFLALILTAIVVLLIFFLIRGTGGLFDGRDTGRPRESGGIGAWFGGLFGGSDERDTYSDDEPGLFARWFGGDDKIDTYPGDEPSISEKVFGRDEDKPRTCEDVSGFNALALVEKIWTSSGDSETEQLRQIENLCRGELAQFDDIESSCREACAQDDGCFNECTAAADVARLEAKGRYQDSVFNYRSAKAAKHMKLGETDQAAQEMATVELEADGNPTILGKMAAFDIKILDLFNKEIGTYEETGRSATELRTNSEKYKEERKVTQKTLGCLELTRSAQSVFEDLKKRGLSIVDPSANREIDRLEEIEKRCKADAEGNSDDPEIQKAYYSAVYDYRSNLGRQYFEVGRYDKAKEHFEYILKNTKGNPQENAINDWDSLVAGLYRNRLQDIRVGASDPITKKTLNAKIDRLKELLGEVTTSRTDIDTFKESLTNPDVDASKFQLTIPTP